MRKICYVSGTRADFGLMRRTLELAARSPALDVWLCVTGMHLVPAYGNTIAEVEQSGLRIAARIPVHLDGTSGVVMAKAIARELDGLIDAFQRERPDIVVVLGDRGEMLAAAIAAIHLNIPVVQIHGGERSGTVDEPVRHAISKLAHYHFTATAEARERLLRMGENPGRVFVTGAPGLDDLQPSGARREVLCKTLDLDPKQPIALVIFHPVVQEAEDAGRQTDALAEAVVRAGLQAVWMLPNADAGGASVRASAERLSAQPGIRLLPHLPRQEYIAWLAAADLMLGNSSSGIIEAASFQLPVVNIGTRQHLREQSANVVNVVPDAAAILDAIQRCLAAPRAPVVNVYGDGQSAPRIVDLLASLPLDAELLKKTNAY